MTIPAAYRKVNFVYDYSGRRVEKRVVKRDSSDNTAWAANPIERRRFVWGSTGGGFQGGPGVSPGSWLMLRETIETDANADGDLLDTGDSTRVKCYTWGRDLGSQSVPQPPSAVISLGINRDSHLISGSGPLDWRSGRHVERCGRVLRRRVRL
ncbi:MAG: hypothetical protein HZB38_01305 [Planctomycetes bacterium]|nr:hypothetical protein [Planctomycetota bacterium]